MLRRLLYRPGINTALRTMLRPFAPVIPASLRFPIVEPFDLDIGSGQRLRIVSNETSYVSKVLFWQGIQGYEYHLVPIFQELAATADVVIDVGANIGYYSLLAAAANPGARIAAFEPSPSAYAYLLRNLEANPVGHVKAERLALSDRPGRISFIEARNPRFPTVAHHLTGASGIDDPGSGYVHERPIEVEATTLDAYLAANLEGHVDLLKIDAEASEHLVLRGAARVLREDRPVIFCEALPGRVEREMEAIFGEFEYALFNAGPAGIRPVQRLEGENLDSHDFVAVPRARAETFASRYVR